MKIILAKLALEKGLAQVANAIVSRGSLPILQNVLLEADAKNGKLTMTGTNLDIYIRCQIAAEIEADGSITLPHRKLLQIVRALSGDKVAITVKETRVKITSKESSFQIMGLEAGEFPPIPKSGKKDAFSLPQADFRLILKQVSYAQSSDENRYILNGVYFDCGGKDSTPASTLTLVATDGRRLSCHSSKIVTENDKVSELIMPAKSVLELQRILGDAGEVAFFLNKNTVFCYLDVPENDVFTDKIVIISKTVEGNYPNYKQVIPKKEKMTLATISREEWLSAVERVAIMSKDETVKLVLGNGRLKISAQNTEIGEAHDSLVIECDTPEAEVAFNARYLCDILKTMPEDKIEFRFGDGVSPGLFTSKAGFTGVVMPCRLG